MTRNKITVDTRPVAGHYAAPNEKIIEFSSPAGGGLISFTLTHFGLSVHVYRQDITVHVTAGEVYEPVPSGNLRWDETLYKAAKAFVTNWEARHEITEG